MEEVLGSVAAEALDVGQQVWAAVKPVVVEALVIGITLGVVWVKRKLDTTTLPAMVDIETRTRVAHVRGNVKTPGSIKLDEVAKVATTDLGQTWLGKTAIGRAVIEAGVRASIEAMKPIADQMAETAVRHSMMPPADGAAVPPVIPKRSPTGFSGQTFPAVKVIADVAATEEPSEQ